MKPKRTRRSSDKVTVRKRLSGGSLAFRSRITNGSAMLEYVDGRSAYARRFRDLIHAYASDLGGDDILSEGQKALVRRAALIQIELEFQEAKLATMHDDGQLPEASRIESYGRNANTLRRLIESLGLHQGRRQNCIELTPLEYARQRVEAAE